jgi:dipicolinate synthase subunit B
MRNLRPVIIGISTNDALSRNAKNLGALLNEKHIFMIPFRQDAPFEKPCSLISDMRLLVDTVVLALDGKQLQPILVDTNS